MLDLDLTDGDPAKRIHLGRFGEEQLFGLSRLVDGPVASGDIQFLCNPTVLQELQATRDSNRRDALLSRAKLLSFTEFNKTIFPLKFPAVFVTPQEQEELQIILIDYPAFRKDEKIIADSSFNEKIDVLLTCEKDLARKIPQIGKVKVMLPSQLWEYWQIHG